MPSSTRGSEASDASIQLCDRCDARITITTDETSMDMTHTSFDSLPSPHETTGILRLISDAESELSLCDNEILRLQSILGQLERKRLRLKCLIEAQRSLLSPVRNVPEEIWGEIFSQTCIKHTFIFGADKSAKTVLPSTLLSSVCSRWRAVVHAAPRLWSDLVIFARPSSVEDTDGKMNLINKCLQRSGDVPLTLVVTLDSQGLASDNPMWMDHPRLAAFRLILDALIRRSPQWRELTIGVDSTHLLVHPIYALLVGKLPLLEVLGIGVADSFQHTVNAFDSAPALRKLRAFTPLGNESTVMLQIPWRQLLCLEVSYVSADQLLDFLHRSPAAASVNWTNPTLQEHSRELQKSSSNISSLTIQFVVGPFEEITGVNAVPPLLEVITLPLLSSFVVESNVTRSWFHEPFLAFIARSSCRLTHLHLVGISILVTEFDEILQVTPSLASLTITQPEIGAQSSTRLPDETALSGLELRDDTIPLVPLLSSLNLIVTHSFDELSFLAMVRSRWVRSLTGTDDRHQTRVAPWENVFLDTDDLDERSEAELRDLQDLGVPIDFVTRSEASVFPGILSEAS